VKALTERTTSKALERLRILQHARRFESALRNVWIPARVNGVNLRDLFRLQEDYDNLLKSIEVLFSHQQDEEFRAAEAIKARAADIVTSELVQEARRKAEEAAIKSTLSF